MDEFYTVNQTAITLKVHPLTVRRYIKEGKLKAVRVGGNIRISQNEIRSFTQAFIPHTKHFKTQTTIHPNAQTKPFSFSDPFLSLKGRGLNINKLEN